jgi:hypothetical protein
MSITFPSLHINLPLFQLMAAAELEVVVAMVPVVKALVVDVVLLIGIARRARRQYHPPKSLFTHSPIYPVIRTRRFISLGAATMAILNSRRNKQPMSMSLSKVLTVIPPLPVTGVHQMLPPMPTHGVLQMQLMPTLGLLQLAMLPLLPKKVTKLKAVPAGKEKSRRKTIP